MKEEEERKKKLVKEGLGPWHGRANSLENGWFFG